MPPSLRCKSAKSTEIRNDSRKSPRKRKLPQETEDTSDRRSSISDKTPKRKSRTVVNLDKTVPKREAVPKLESTPSSFASVSTPSTSYLSDTEKTCAFYRTKTDSDGKPVFSKSLIKYFMTIDSPEMDDLKKKHFNTSFIREIPRDKSSLKIFSEEGEEDNQMLDNVCVCVPKLDDFNMPEVPGTEHATIFESMPIGGDSDEELKKLTKHHSRTEKKRKSTRCTEFKGKPLPDQALAVDYTSLLDSESSNDNTPDDVKKTERKRNKQETTLPGAVRDNKNSILLS